MKYLGIDYGQKRTGIAVTDDGGRMAFPRTTITMKTRDRFFEELLTIIEKEQPHAIVVGLPLSLNKEETLTTRQVRNFTARLKRRCSLPVYYMEEALSSNEAEERLRDAVVPVSKRKGILDQQAAILILESFLRLPEEKRIVA